MNRMQDIPGAAMGSYFRTMWSLMKMDIKAQAAPAIACVVTIIALIAWKYHSPDGPWPLMLMFFGLGFFSILGSQVFESGKEWRGVTLSSRVPVSLLVRILVRMGAALVLWAAMFAITILAWPTHVPFNSIAFLMVGGLAFLMGLLISFFLTGLNAALGALAIGVLSTYVPYFIQTFLGQQFQVNGHPGLPYQLHTGHIALLWGLALLAVVACLVAYVVRYRPERMTGRPVMVILLSGMLVFAGSSSILIYRADQKIDRILSAQAMEWSTKLNMLNPGDFRVPDLDPSVLAEIRFRAEDGWSHLGWLLDNTEQPPQLTADQFRSLVVAGQCQDMELPAISEDHAALDWEHYTHLNLSLGVSRMWMNIENMLDREDVPFPSKLEALLSWMSLKRRSEEAGALFQSGLSALQALKIQQFCEGNKSSGDKNTVRLMRALEKFSVKREPSLPFQQVRIGIFSCASHRDGFDALERAAGFADDSVFRYIRNEGARLAVQDVRYLWDAPGRAEFLQKLAAMEASRKKE